MPYMHASKHEHYDRSSACREEETTDGPEASDNSGSEQIMVDPYCVFGRYFRDEYGKGKGRGRGKGKGKGKERGSACVDEC